MTASFTIAQVERFKREAKRLHRDSHISHSQALDQIANANGYNNWSLLTKDLSVNCLKSSSSRTGRGAGHKDGQGPCQFVGSDR